MTTALQTITVETRGRIGLVTLDRPSRRNAISTTMIEELPRAVTDLGTSGTVDVIVLTARDPAFCAGLDLHELGSTGANLGLPDRPDYPWPWRLDIPVIGAINGPAVAGGFELATFCDILLASDRAVFADTHGRIGQFAGAGLTVRLAEAVGLQRARLLCLSGNFIDAATAVRWGVVADVVPHDELIDRAVGLATDIAGNDQRAVRRTLAHFRELAGITGRPGMALVDQAMDGWNDEFQPSDVADRTTRVMERSRAQRAGVAAAPGTEAPS